MRQMLEGRFPDRVIRNAVRRMLSKGPLSRDILSKLRVYKGPDHPHAGQSPVLLDVGSFNRKNCKGGRV
jgi:large subunit ribosomal protein L13